MVVVGEAGFDLIVLTGEAEIVGDGAGEGLDFTPGLVGSGPDGCFGGWSCGGAAQMIGMNVGESVGGAHDVNHGQWQIDRAVIVTGQPDIIPGLCTRCSIGLGQEMVVIVIGVGDLAYRVRQGLWRPAWSIARGRYSRKWPKRQSSASPHSSGFVCCRYNPAIRLCEYQQ